MIKILSSVLISLIILGCNTISLSPNIEQKKQTSSKMKTNSSYY